MVAGLCVVVLAVVPLVVSPDHLALPGWRVSIVLLGAMGVFALCWQAFRQSSEEAEQWRLLRKLEVKAFAAAPTLPGPSQDGAFLAITFPATDLFDEKIRDDYL